MPSSASSLRGPVVVDARGLATSNVDITIEPMLVRPAANAIRIDHVKSRLVGWSPPRIHGRVSRSTVNTVAAI
jgi:hypothetical protein